MKVRIKVTHPTDKAYLYYIYNTPDGTWNYVDRNGNPVSPEFFGITNVVEMHFALEEASSPEDALEIFQHYGSAILRFELLTLARR